MTEGDLPNYVLVCLDCFPRGSPKAPLSFGGIGICSVCEGPVYGADQQTVNFVWAARANLPPLSPQTERRILEMPTDYDVSFDEAEKNKDKA